MMRDPSSVPRTVRHAVDAICTENTNINTSMYLFIVIRDIEI